MSQIQRGLIIITIGCVIYLIIMWISSINLLIYYPQLDTVSENNYFSNCTKSKHLWIRCLEYLNHISAQKIVPIDSNCNTWPPFSVECLIDKRLPAFNLALKFPLALNALDSTDEVTYNKFGDVIYANCKKQEILDDEEPEEMGSNSTDYSIYPQNLNFSKLIYDIQHGIPVQTKPINNPDMFALQIPKGICKPHNNNFIPSLIIIIKSGVYNSEKRNRARRTFMQKHLWSNFSVQFVFVLGIPMENESNIFTFDGNTYVLDTNWWSLSKQYGSSKWQFMKQLAVEADLYEDLLIGSFHDTYYNLTKKLIFSLRWISGLCPKQVPLYLFMDDDYDLIPRNIIKFYNNYSEDNLRNMSGGFLGSSRTVFRPIPDETDSVWAMTVKEFPWLFYPQYYHGFTYMIGANLVHRFAIASAFIKEIRIDDAYLGILFYKLNITLVPLNIIGDTFHKKNIMTGGINLRYKTSQNIMNWTSDLRIHYNIQYDNYYDRHHLNDDYLMRNESYIQHPVLTRNAKGESVAYILKEHCPNYFNLTASLQAILSGLSIYEIPINNDALIAMRLPSDTCNPCSRNKKVDLVVIVKSCVYCFEQRAYARTTYMNKDLWKNFSVHFVFTVGLPTPNETSTYYFDGVKTSLTTNSLYLSTKYESSKWSAAKILSNESKVYNDLLIGAFYDNYFNLTTKMIFTLRWITNFCISHSPLFLFIDDDYLLHPNNTINLIRKFNKSQLKSLAAGSVYFGKVDRPNNGYGARWAISYNEYPWDYYPRYFLGIGYFLGSDVVHDASIAMAFTKQLRIDDVYLGIILKRLNITLTHLDNIHIHPGKEQLKSGAFMITKYLAENYVNWTTGLIK
ncbi:Beta-1,3-galactosyltransferase brn [Schistosoma japonicum]|uniref:Beta-1,3-galactosyltransferase brn n=1 Tax=Schistosoma japonicum TaxID=6182 RepID=A0A4Z2DPM1_SCHJA|nr:Beta-1,3-galactosyltransferase brn [Schistosoma japonicum]